MDRYANSNALFKSFHLFVIAVLMLVWAFCLSPAHAAAVVSSVDYPVIAHHAKLNISGADFLAASSVTIGGSPQTFLVDSGNTIIIESILSATNLGQQDLIVTTPSGDSDPFVVTVINLMINELDCDQLSTDTQEFVELSTGGIGSVNLDGYVLVFYNGADDASYRAQDLDVEANANGYLVVGNSGVSPTPEIILGNSTLQNGPDAIAVHQGIAFNFPNDTPVTSVGLLDAIEYSKDANEDSVLLEALLGSGPEAVHLNEGILGDSESDSIARCDAGRLDARAFLTSDIPTPSAINGCVDPGYEVIPTLSDWGMITLALLLITAGIVVVRRRQKNLTN